MKELMPRMIVAMMIMLVGVGSLWLIMVFTGNTGRKFEITTAECPMQTQVVEQNVVEFEGSVKFLVRELIFDFLF